MAIDFSIASSILSLSRTVDNPRWLRATVPKFTFADRTSHEDNFGLFIMASLYQSIFKTITHD